MSKEGKSCDQRTAKTAFLNCKSIFISALCVELHNKKPWRLFLSFMSKAPCNQSTARTDRPFSLSVKARLVLGFTWLSDPSSCPSSSLWVSLKSVGSEMPSFVQMLCETAHAVMIFTQVSGVDCRQPPESHLPQSDGSFYSISHSLVGCVVAVILFGLATGVRSTGLSG